VVLVEDGDVIPIIQRESTEDLLRNDLPLGERE
jgi:hypothetical protein